MTPIQTHFSDLTRKKYDLICHYLQQVDYKLVYVDCKTELDYVLLRKVNLYPNIDFLTDYFDVTYFVDIDVFHIEYPLNVKGMIDALNINFWVSIEGTDAFLQTIVKKIKEIDDFYQVNKLRDLERADIQTIYNL